MCNHQHSQGREYFHHPKRSSPPQSFTLSSTPHWLWTILIVFCHYTFVFFRISYNHMLCNFFYVWVFAVSMLLKFIPVDKYICNYLYLLLSSPRDGYATTCLSIHKVKDIWVVSSYEYCIQFSMWTCVFFSLW